MPRRYKLGADGQAHPAYFGKLPEEFTKEDTLRFLADTDIQLYRLLSADTHAALRAEGYEYKNGGLIPISEKETVMQEQTDGAPAATQEPMKLDVSVKLIDPVKNLIGFASVNIGGIVIDDFKVVNGKNGIFLGEPSKPDPTTRTGYRSTARVTNRALQERLSAAAADGYNMAVEKLIARAEALRPKPIREQMANAAKEAAKENATRPAQAKGKEARDDR